jgi:hypothetical protein
MSMEEILQEMLATLQRMEKRMDEELRRQAKERSRALQPGGSREKAAPL